MKTTLLSLLLLLAGGAACAQEPFKPLPVDETTRLVTYTDVVPTPGVLQSSLLARARVWAGRVGVADKPPVLVSELGTDVLVVAGSQNINPAYDVRPQTLYFLVRLALREGRYQYRFEEYTLVTSAVGGLTTFETAEQLFQREAPPRATGSSYATRLRRAFDEATAQAAINLHTALTTSLTTAPGTGDKW